MFSLLHRSNVHDRTAIIGIYRAVILVQWNVTRACGEEEVFSTAETILEQTAKSTWVPLSLHVLKDLMISVNAPILT